MTALRIDGQRADSFLTFLPTRLPLRCHSVQDFLRDLSTSGSLQDKMGQLNIASSGLLVGAIGQEFFKATTNARQTRT